MLLRNIARFTNLSTQNKKIFSLNSSVFKFSTQNTNELKAIAQMLGIKQQKLNEEIEHNGDVRLVNKNSKLIGIFTKQQALDHVKKHGMDLLLVSDQVSPIICKATNYKEFLYDKFVKEIILQDSNFKKRKTTKKSTKRLKLSTSISSGDLRNKAHQLTELAKKFENFAVYIYCNDKTVESAKNILHTFSEYVRNEMQLDAASEEDAIGNVQIDASFLDENELENEEDISNINQKVEMKFISSMYESQQQAQFSEEEIKGLIRQYFSKNKQGKENLDHVSVKEEDNSIEKGFKEEYGDEDFHDMVLQNVQETQQNDFSSDLTRSMQTYAEESNVSYEELKANVEELKLKYNSGMAEEAISKELLAEQQFRLKTVERIMKLVNQ